MAGNIQAARCLCNWCLVMESLSPAARYMSKKDKLLHANPPESDVLAEGDRIVALARTSARPTLC
jgi:hypothetical protein